MRKPISPFDFKCLAVRKNLHRKVKKYCKQRGLKIHWVTAAALTQLMEGDK